MRRLDSGLFVLQLLDYIMIDISAAGTSTVSVNLNVLIAGFGLMNGIGYNSKSIGLAIVRPWSRIQATVGHYCVVSVSFSHLS